jgi:hypothetical protein
VSRKKPVFFRIFRKNFTKRCQNMAISKELWTSETQSSSKTLTLPAITMFLKVRVETAIFNGWFRPEFSWDINIFFTNGKIVWFSGKSRQLSVIYYRPMYYERELRI